MPSFFSALRQLFGRARPSQAAAGDVLPDHESGVRRLLAGAQGGEYVAFTSLADARLVQDATVVMEGDYGGQIYLTCPVRLVNCDETRLDQLLTDLDGLGWGDPEGARVYYERLPVGAGVGGGMGGGAVVDGVWLHDELRRLGLERSVEDVISGERTRIDEVSSPR